MSQGTELGPELYLLFTSDIPKFKHEIITFSDDTAVIAVGKDHEEAA